jgi:hypothetical protein
MKYYLLRCDKFNENDNVDVDNYIFYAYMDVNLALRGYDAHASVIGEETVEKINLRVEVRTADLSEYNFNSDEYSHKRHTDVLEKEPYVYECHRNYKGSVHGMLPFSGALDSVETLVRKKFKESLP